MNDYWLEQIARDVHSIACVVIGVVIFVAFVGFVMAMACGEEAGEEDE